ncbi:monovalent cation:proton antiporter-2 (CPA2) family protein [Shewanella surugensis]|uniref:Monovalent cation:proton antiporter-2 (CPA2) family protein n=1 Tax=Shewanella surugensis TaxID=212020 RepID=A0ABT0L853_9GAMM|nr:monovalent cation:proton antiporter-2 (CPA2) family protein [Shewanella surugensis]MCL1123872.1 monovalent cation:proton antiporter-2 (CPA2) family protein [Shewanella surugensis]
MNHGLLIQILFMLVIAIISIAMLRRAGLPAILAYLLTGVISGPSGFNWFSQQEIHSVAELGIVLLMFSLGLEFSLPRLWAMRRKVFGLGTAQLVVTVGLAMLASLLCGLNPVESLVVGAAIALSSTAIVLKLLNDQGWIRRRHGELSVSVLLFQDIAVVPLLILLPLLAENQQTFVWFDIGMSLLEGLGAFVALVVVGKWTLPKLFDEVARARSNELFVLSTLVVSLVTGAITQWVGLSMALGAFIAGILLGESQYKRQLEADIRPFRDLLMGLFFISIGMLLDFQIVMNYWWQILLLLVAIMFGKSAIIFVLLRWTKESFRISLSTAITLAQVGEFSFVILSLGVSYQLIDSRTSTILVMVAVLSMALAPWLVRNSVDIARRLQGIKTLADTVDSIKVVPSASGELVLILGYGRVGQTIARFMKVEAIPYLVLDLDPKRVAEARAAGEPVYFGDGSQRSILKQAKIREAKLVVITFGSRKVLEDVLSLCRQLSVDAKILVRTRDDIDMEELELAGASQVISETLEGSLMLVSQVLYQSGVPLSRILKRLEFERRHHYRYLHGFFSGANTDFTLERLHALALPQEAYAVGKTLEMIPWQKLRVELRAVRRAGAEVESPPLDWECKAGDIIILLGKPRRIERAETWLLKG